MQHRTGPALGLALALAVFAGGVLARADDSAGRTARYRFKPYAEFLADVADRPRRVVYTPYPVSSRHGLVRGFVHVSDGSAVLSRTDLVADGPLPIVIRRAYHSARTATGSFGRGGWRLTVEETMTRVGDGGFEYVYGNGAKLHFDGAGRFASPLDAFLTDVVQFSRPDPSTILVRTRTGLSKRFRAVSAGFQLAEVLDGFDNRLEFEYSATGALVGIVASSGARITLARAGSGAIHTVSDSAGRTVRYRYDDRSHLSAVTDPGGHEWRYRYDRRGRLAATTAPSDVEDVAFEYDAAGRVAVSRINGKRHAFAYRGRTTRVTVDELSTQFMAAPSGVTLSVLNPLGTRTELQLDASGVPMRLTRNGQLSVQLLQHQPGAGTAFRARFVSAGGEGYWLRYDGLGRVVTVASDSAGSLYEVRGYRGIAPERVLHADRSEELAQFDTGGELALLRRRDGSTLTLERQGPSWQIVASHGRSAELHFDASGRLARATSPDGHVLTFGYNGVGLRESTATSYGARVQYTYDASGNLFQSQVGSAAGVGPGWTYALGPDQRVNSVAATAGSLTRFDYGSADLLGEVSAETTGNLRFHYDALRRLTRVEHGEQPALEYQYAPGEPDIVAQLSARALPVYNQQREINDFGSRFDVQLTRVRPASIGLFTDDEVSQELTLAGDPSRWSPAAYVTRSVDALRIDALLGRDPRGIGEFTTPSNRLFVPAEYWSVNCCVCLCSDPPFECYVP